MVVARWMATCLAVTIAAELEAEIRDDEKHCQQLREFVGKAVAS